MKKLKRLFTDHPQSAGETYLEHLRMAVFFGSSCLLMGLVSIVHALLPFLFEKTASQMFAKISAWLAARAHKTE